MNEKHTTAFRTDKGTWEALNEIKESHDRSINWLLNEATKDLIAKYKHLHQGDKPQ